MPYRYRAPTRHNGGGRKELEGGRKSFNYHWGIGLPAIPGVGEIVYSPFMFGVFGGTVRTAMYADITANDNNPILQLRHQQHRFRRTRLIGTLKKDDAKSKTRQHHMAIKSVTYAYGIMRERQR